MPEREAMSELKTCGTCRFFGLGQTDQRDYHVPEAYALCGRIKMTESYGRTEVTPANGHKAAVVDGSGYYAALCVTTDFGCNMWEPKR